MLNLAIELDHSLFKVLQPPVMKLVEAIDRWIDSEDLWLYEYFYEGINSILV